MDWCLGLGKPRADLPGPRPALMVHWPMHAVGAHDRANLLWSEQLVGRTNSTKFLFFLSLSRGLDFSGTSFKTDFKTFF